jgi:endonuclease/exonuclease/phosphatase family metal-dependent hydrolase
MNIRLATYNIHKFVGHDGKRDEARILAIIKSLNADILALQEFVLQDHSGNVAMVEAFAAKAGYHFIAQPMLRAKGMVQFNLLLTRKAVAAQNLMILPHDGKEPRGAIDAFLYFEGKKIQIAATHLGLTPAARMRQLKMILDLGSHQDEMPFALLGDLNIMLPWEAARIHLEKTFMGQKQVASFPARLPLLAFDSIYVRQAEMIQLVRAFAKGPARSASDHLPIVADIFLT